MQVCGLQSSAVHNATQRISTRPLSGWSSQQTNGRRNLACAMRATAPEDETKEMVAGVMKQGVRASAWAIESVTDIAVAVVPDTVERSTVNLCIKGAAGIILIGVANSILSFAFTLGIIALAAFVAIGVFGIDVDDVMSAAKGKKKN